MVAAATYMSQWLPGVRPYIWILVFSALLLTLNLRSVGSYGRVEFWLSMIKLATIIAFILIGAGLLFSGRAVPQYNAQGGFFPKGLFSPLIAMTFAVYSFGGVEMVAVTTGESLSPKETPRAVWITFLTLTFVYVGSMVVLLGVMPWNHAGVTESPFVTTFRTIRIPHASGVMNFVVLTAALSGANAALYVASRMVFSLARTGWAPARLGRLNPSGSPQYAVAVSSFGVLFALALVLWAPENAFRYIVGAASLARGPGSPPASLSTGTMGINPGTDHGDDRAHPNLVDPARQSLERSCLHRCLDRGLRSGQAAARHESEIEIVSGATATISKPVGRARS
jgi:L-asparagine transporter-like permease